MAYKAAYPPTGSPDSASKAPSTFSTSDKMSLHSKSDLMYTPELSDKELGSQSSAAGSTMAAAAKRKWLLLLIFSVSQFLDLCSRASAVVFIGGISRDLGIDYETSTWVLNSYGVTFGSFLLLWGRVSDLYSAKMVFSLGFLFCGVFSLIISFMTNEYAFYVFRALYGIAAAATIPSAFQLILAVFEPKEVQIALSLFGLSGAIANAMGLLIGGAFGEIESSGQGADWRWFFRFVCFVSVPFALVSWLLIPHLPSKLHANRTAKWKLLDIPGSLLILAALMLLNVGLTLGASRGWVNARFLVPTILSLPLAVAFFVWEYRVGEVKALIPVSLWKINNIALMSWVALGLFPYMACIQLPLVERYQMINGESSIKAAVRMLPQGLAMCLVVILASGILKKIVNMRWAIGFCLVIAAAMYVPLIYGDGSITRSGYWSYYVPAFIVGSAAFAIAYLGVNITMMTAASSSMAGVVGALFQVCLQTGTTTGISIQSGLLTVHEGSIGNWKNIQTSWWFQFGWCLIMGLSVLAFYQPRVIASQASEQAAEALQLEGRRQEV